MKTICRAHKIMVHCTDFLTGNKLLDFRVIFQPSFWLAAAASVFFTVSQQTSRYFCLRRKNQARKRRLGKKRIKLKWGCSFSKAKKNTGNKSTLVKNQRKITLQKSKSVFLLLKYRILARKLTWGGLEIMQNFKSIYLWVEKSHEKMTYF